MEVRSSYYCRQPTDLFDYFGPDRTGYSKYDYDLDQAKLFCELLEILQEIRAMFNTERERYKDKNEYTRGFIAKYQFDPFKKIDDELKRLNEQSGGKLAWLWFFSEPIKSEKTPLPDGPYYEVKLGPVKKRGW